MFLILTDYLLFKQLCKQQLEFPMSYYFYNLLTSKTYNHVETYDQVSADSSLLIFFHIIKYNSSAHNVIPLFWVKSEYDLTFEFLQPQLMKLKVEPTFEQIN